MTEENIIVEKTLSIIKPDAVKRNIIGDVLRKFEQSGLRIAAMKKIRLTKDEARNFYIVHKERPFYDSLTAFMSEGPIVVLIIEGDSAITRVREIMGATNPIEAKPGSIRAEFATDIERNVVHGSDSPASVSCEIPFFFSALEIL